MSNEEIVPYDITLAKTLRAYRQGAQKGKVAVVTDENVYAEGEGDGFFDIEDFFEAGIYRHVSVYDPELGKEIWLGNYDFYSQIGDVVAYEASGDGYVMVKNFTREPREQIINNFDKAYRVVFGKGKGQGK